MAQSATPALLVGHAGSAGLSQASELLIAAFSLGMQNRLIRHRVGHSTPAAGTGSVRLVG